MRLLRLSDVDTSQTDGVFYHSRVRALLVLASALAAIIGLGSHAVSARWIIGYFVVVGIAFFVVLMGRFITARFRPSNWLVRMSDMGIFIQFRSYLNYHLPAEDLTVVFIAYGEIRSARMVRERVTVPDNEGGSSTQTLRYVELELAGDTAPRTKELSAEAAERAPKEKRWYGSSSTLYQDHPVRMQSPPFLQVRWTVIPGAQNFLEALRPYTTIAEPIQSSQDFVNLQSLSREEQQKRLRELAQRGETITAIYMARKLYGHGLSEAKQMVDNLCSESSERPSVSPMTRQ
jgi:hypothetical protein